MAKKAKWLYTLAVLGALGFSASQAFAARKAPDPCPCTIPFDTAQCSIPGCCPSGFGMCTESLDCICG